MAAEHDMPHAQLALFAHELRGALSVIAGYTALLRRGLSQAEEAAALDGIDRAIARADVLCSDVLAGRSPAERLVTREILDLAQLAEQAAADLHSETGRTVRLTFDEDAALTVPGDAKALARVLGNLLGNAAKYSSPDSPIELEVAHAARPYTGDVVVFSVADRGPGIPAEQRELVFEPFQRLERDQNAPGTGLGLTVVRDVVQAHDGRAEILDRDGGGTVVRIELPAAS
jgi:signal transduction histidine kinase